MAVAGGASAESVAQLDRPRAWRQRLGPWPLLALFLLIQTVAWTVIPPRVFSALNPNTVELAMWGRDFYMVNYKHPALPSWVLDLFYMVFGNRLWVPYFLSEVCISIASIFVFLLGRDIMGPRRALLGVLLLPAAPSLTIEALRYNHNLVQLAFWTAFCFSLWRASSSGRRNWWLIAAAVAAVGLYAKFSLLLIIAFGALWIVLDPATRAELRGRKIYLALGLFVVLLVPLVAALVQDGFGAVNWIAAESGERGISTSHFIWRVGRVILVMIAAALVCAGINLIPPRTAVAGPAAPSIDRRGVKFLIVMAAGPIILLFALSVAMKLRLEWAGPTYSLAGLLLVALGSALWPRLAFLTQAGLRHALIAVLATLYILHGQANHGLAERRHAANPSKPNYPAAEMAKRFDRIWKDKVGAPLQIVGGDNWTAGVVGLLAEDQPGLFSYLDITHSRAMTPDRIAREGMLVLWSHGSTWQPTPDLFSHGYFQGHETFPWGAKKNTRAEPLEIDYLIVPPSH
jgi:hypothetical protein